MNKGFTTYKTINTTEMLQLGHPINLDPLTIALYPSIVT